MKPTPEFLAKRKAAILADLLLKVDAEDFHGVADCAMDLREIDAQLKLLSLLDPVDQSLRSMNAEYDRLYVAAKAAEPAIGEPIQVRLKNA